MILCQFFAEGDPAAQPRLRPCTRRDGRLGVHMPATAQGWRLRLELAARSAWHGAPLDEPLEVDLLFVFGRPPSHYGAKGALRSTAPAHHVVKPDRDNIEKSTTDALNGVLWRDDAMIVGGYVAKRYVDEAEPRPGCLVTVRRLA